MRLTLLGRRQAASTESAGSKPLTFMPKPIAISATSEPMAPRPITPRVLPAISLPAKRFFSCSISLESSAWSLKWACDSAKAIPRMMPREASNKPQSTSSFTALALAPGVLKTTTPRSVQSVTGTLLVPAPARAIARASPTSSIVSLWLRSKIASPPIASPATI